MGLEKLPFEMLLSLEDDEGRDIVGWVEIHDEEHLEEYGSVTIKVENLKMLLDEIEEWEVVRLYAHGDRPLFIIREDEDEDYCMALAPWVEDYDDD